ncbi:MAG: hypothetical protein NDI60_02165 [Elusimicrobiales bacterium]|nr:hypothetical protein [Elusimicrobiales bacterium]
MNSSRPLALCLLLACPAAVLAGETVAVLSSDGGAYMEAFSAFQAAYGSEVPYSNLAAGKPSFPPAADIVVAFGGKAANYSYPAPLQVVYCMAPGIFVSDPAGRTKGAKISLIPSFTEIFLRIKELQPGIRRLRVFWMTPVFGNFDDNLTKEGAAHGIAVTAVKVPSIEDMPSLLRQTRGTADAFWLPPDPLLLTPENLMIMRDFSWDNGIPFYGSTKGMTREGAAASIGVSFKDMGETAARAVLALRAGEKLPEIIFPPAVELTLNASAARKCKLQLTPEILRRANYLFP